MRPLRLGGGWLRHCPLLAVPKAQFVRGHRKLHPSPCQPERFHSKLPEHRFKFLENALPGSDSEINAKDLPASLDEFIQAPTAEAEATKADFADAPFTLDPEVSPFPMETPEIAYGSGRALRFATKYRAKRRTHWTHELVRGPEGRPVQVYYSRTLADSEKIAQKFRNEAILGFDMEWPWKQPLDGSREARNFPLRRRVGLIQLACEDKIALFHIGMMPGKTAGELVAPSLRQIIESPEIAKLGVSILESDFSRLKRWFGLSPRGAFELNHLNAVVNYTGDELGLPTTYVGLSKLVNKYLGLPLAKSKRIRMSDWSAALRQAQITYAATDAYAAFMVFQRMNQQRLAMEMVPPLPLYADTYQNRTHMAPIEKIMLRLPQEGIGFQPIQATKFFDLAKAVKARLSPMEKLDQTRIIWDHIRGLQEAGQAVRTARDERDQCMNRAETAASAAAVAELAAVAAANSMEARHIEKISRPPTLNMGVSFSMKNRTTEDTGESVEDVDSSLVFGSPIASPSQSTSNCKKEVVKCSKAEPEPELQPHPELGLDIRAPTPPPDH